MCTSVAQATDADQSPLSLPGTEAPFSTLYNSVGGNSSPAKLRWGSYTVIVDHAPGPIDRLRIVDGQGRIEKKILAYYIDTVQTVRLGLHGQYALCVSTEGQGNLGQDDREFFFLGEPRLREALEVIGGVDHVREMPNGTCLFVMEHSPLMEWIGDICHACDPGVTLVIEWTGQQAFLANRQYPGVAVSTSMSSRDDMPASFDPDYDVGDAVGYYSNQVTIGRGSSALHWLRSHMSASDWSRFRDLLPEANKRLKDIHRMFWVEDKAVYDLTHTAD